MVEGPKVKTKKERLAVLVGKQLQAIKTLQPVLISNVTSERPTLENILVVGKELFLHFTNDLYFRIHFEMNGSERIAASPPLSAPSSSSFQTSLISEMDAKYAGELQTNPRSRKNLTCIFHFADLSSLYLFDSNVTILSAAKSRSFPQYYADRSQRDIMHPNYSKESHIQYLSNVCQNERRELRNCTLQELLLDQEVVPGVGNIIKCESLHLCRLSPFLKGEDLTPAQLTLLLAHVYSFSWSWYHSCKSNKNYQHFQYQVYGRSQCLECNQTIRLIRDQASKRITYYCPHCQLSNSSNKENQSNRSEINSTLVLKSNACSFCNFQNISGIQECEICGNPLTSPSKPVILQSTTTVEDDTGYLSGLFSPQLKCSSCSSECQLQRVRKASDNIHRLFWACRRSSTIKKQQRGSKPCSFFAWADQRFPTCRQHPQRRTILRRVLKDGPNNGKYFFSCSTAQCSYFLWLKDYYLQSSGGTDRDNSLLGKRKIDTEAMNQEKLNFVLNIPL